jgi:hypothetical protein
MLPKTAPHLLGNSGAGDVMQKSTREEEKKKILPLLPEQSSPLQRDAKEKNALAYTGRCGLGSFTGDCAQFFLASQQKCSARSAFATESSSLGEWQCCGGR